MLNVLKRTWYKAKARPDERTRKRGGERRVRNGETVIRTEIRNSAEHHATQRFCCWNVRVVIVTEELR